MQEQGVWKNEFLSSNSQNQSRIIHWNEWTGELKQKAQE